MANRKKKTTTQLGKQLPRYRFFLNPYEDMRFTKCPQCDNKMHQRKLPLVIHVDPMQVLSLNKTCRYCPHCDLLIAHQDDLEHFLASFFTGQRVTPSWRCSGPGMPTLEGHPVFPAATGRGLRRVVRQSLEEKH